MLSEEELNKLKAFYHIYSFEPNFQVVARKNGMKFIIHSNEDCGHNKGHVHIESSDGEIEVDIITFDVINMSGKITPHKKKETIKFIKENQEMFIKHWNEFTNGIEISA